MTTEAPPDGWHRFDGGRSLGEAGSEGGVIVLDEEHDAGSRITIERGGQTAPFSITCGVYGWMCHTRFFATLAEATSACRTMMPELARLAGEERGEDEDENAYLCRMGVEVERFVNAFP